MSFYPKAQAYTTAIASKEQPHKEAQVEDAINLESSMVHVEAEVEKATMEFEQELQEEEAMEMAATEIEKELQVEEDVALACNLSTLVRNEGKKKKKKKKRGLGSSFPERRRNTSLRMQGWRRRKTPINQNQKEKRGWQQSAPKSLAQEN